jgi:signal transduction histidine kinase
MRDPLADKPTPFDSTSAVPSFQGRFGRKVGGLLAVASLLVLLFGTIPLWLSYRNLANSEQIRRLNEHVRLMEEIHSTMHHLVGAIEDRIADEKGASGEIRGWSEKLLSGFSLYEAFHGRQPNGWMKEGDERRLFEQVRGQLLKIVELASTPGGSGEAMQKMARALMPQFTSVAAIHQRAVDEAIEKNRTRMRWIFGLYYALVVVGALVIAGGIYWTSRSIVQPVKRLAAAAQEVASGDFSKRVAVSSDDEVGQLSHSFNIMAARLEEHERFVHGTAALEERERLAREMHDGLAQNLGFLNLKIARMHRMLSSEDRSRARDEIQALKETADALYNDVRQAIFGLRIMVSRQLGLLPTLTEYLHEFSRQTGIRVDLVKESEHREELPPETEIQLIRIIQEALTNVRKHARASRVSLAFRTAEEILEIVIEDDGCGISRSQASTKGKTSFGLQTMEERARGVGGSFEARDAFPMGTRVTVRLPLTPASREARTWTR